MTLGTLADAEAALSRTFGFAGLRDGQRKAIESLLSGRDTLVVLPTGGGKSLCYQVPALVAPGLTVVVSPLIALMDDQVAALERRGVRAAALHSAVDASRANRIDADIRSGAMRLVYLAPERLLVPRTLSMLGNAGVALLAVDEAHCVCDWGHDFRPSYLRIREARQALDGPVTIALTATATPAARAEIVQLLELRTPRVVVSGFDRPNLAFTVEPVTDATHRYARLRELVRGNTAGAVIVYAGTRRRVEVLRRRLSIGRSGVAAYHAGMESKERSEVLDGFLAGKISTLVATNAFGMGVDKPDVRLVVHDTGPGSIEDYYQEAGRAGRDGAPARCVLLHHPHDVRLQESFLARTYPSRASVERCWRLLRELGNGSAQVVIPSAPNAPGMATDLADLEPSLSLLERLGLLRREPRGPREWRVRTVCSAARAAGAQHSLTAHACTCLNALVAFDQQSPAPASVTLAELHVRLRPAEARLALEELESRQLAAVVAREVVVQLVGDGLTARTPPVDWRTLEARAAADREKLASVVGYARTRGCRRAFMLRYFGQTPGAAPCAGCDNCAAS